MKVKGEKFIPGKDPGSPSPGIYPLIAKVRSGKARVDRRKHNLIDEY